MPATPFPSPPLRLPGRPVAGAEPLGDAVCARPVAASSPPCLSSTDILRGQKTVEINHNGATYRLQATRLGKLILTK